MSTPSTFSDELTDIIASLMSECTDDILVCGDANCPGPDDSSVDVELSAGLDSVGLTQLVTQPTRRLPGARNLLDILDASSVSRVTNVTSPCLELTSSLTTVWCQPLSPFACRSQSSNIVRGVILATSTSRHSKTTCASLSYSVSQLQTSTHTLINSTACLLSYWTSTLQSALLAVIRPRSVDGCPTRRSLLSVKPQESPRPTFYLHDDSVSALASSFLPWLVPC